MITMSPTTLVVDSLTGFITVTVHAVIPVPALPGAVLLPVTPPAIEYPNAQLSVSGGGTVMPATAVKMESEAGITDGWKADFTGSDADVSHYAATVKVKWGYQAESAEDSATYP